MIYLLAVLHVPTHKVKHKVDYLGGTLLAGAGRNGGFRVRVTVPLTTADLNGAAASHAPDAVPADPSAPDTVPSAPDQVPR